MSVKDGTLEPGEESEQKNPTNIFEGKVKESNPIGLRSYSISPKDELLKFSILDENFIFSVVFEVNNGMTNTKIKMYRTNNEDGAKLWSYCHNLKVIDGDNEGSCNVENTDDMQSLLKMIIRLLSRHPNELPWKWTKEYGDK